MSEDTHEVCYECGNVFDTAEEGDGADICGECEDIATEPNDPMHGTISEETRQRFSDRCAPEWC